MPPAPVEVTPFEGTSGNDTLFLTQAGLNAGHFDSIWAIGHGGDDTIVRDRTGNYTAWDGDFSPGYVDGGSGFDTVSYTNSPYALSANLTTGIAQADTPNHWATSLAPDFLTSIEGLVGTLYDDHIIGSSARNKLWGHDGDDDIWGESGNDDVWGGQGHDLIYGGDGADKLHGESGNDDLRGGDAADLIYSGDGDDDLRGDASNDTLYGEAGNDTLHGDAGNDALHAGAGDDVAYGGSGNDRVYVSGEGDNDLYGGSGTDWAHYSGSSDVFVNMWGDQAIRTDGSDSLDSIENIETASGNDTVFGTSGTNRIWTGSGNDDVYTMGGGDEVRAGSGHDVVVGYGDNETIYGEGGNDHLYGGDGGDTVSGGAGEDFVEGGDGSDNLWGGADADTFHFAVWESGVDQLKDFDPSEDRLSFGPNFFTGQNDRGFEVSDALWASTMFDGSTVLVADVAGVGLMQFAVIEGVDEDTINQMIANGTIFDVETSSVGDDAPGGFAPQAPIVPFEPSSDLLLG